MMYYDVIQCDATWHERTYVRSFNVIYLSTNYSSKLCYKIRCDVVLRDVHVVLFARPYFLSPISCHFLFIRFHSLSFISPPFFTLPLCPTSLPSFHYLLFTTSTSSSCDDHRDVSTFTARASR